MDSPLGPTLANTFLFYQEDIWLTDYSTEIKPTLYQRYVGDIFCLFDNKSQIKNFETFLNSRHINMSFSRELKNDEKLSFLDILIAKSESGYITSIYRKSTFSGIYLNFKSYVPDVYKFGLINSYFVLIKFVVVGK